MRKIIAAAAAIAALSTAAPAFAEEDFDTMDVTLNVTKSCSVAANALTFNATFVGGNAIDAQTSAVAKCTVGTTYSVGYSNGDNFDATAGVRQLANGAVFVPYELYSDSARTTALSTSSGTGTGVDQTIDIYGRIPASAAAVGAGTYTDRVVVTLTY